MTHPVKIKLCGLSRPCDIEAANEVSPDYVGFVFAPASTRAVTPRQAADLKAMLNPGITAVGVFVDEAPRDIARLLLDGTIDMAQLHGSEDDGFIEQVRQLAGKPVIKAFRIGAPGDIEAANRSAADFVLLDSGAGTGRAFDWQLVAGIDRPYFLAGGLDAENASAALEALQNLGARRPHALDVSSGIETDGLKDKVKMAAFAAAVRKNGRP